MPNPHIEDVEGRVLVSDEAVEHHAERLYARGCEIPAPGGWDGENEGAKEDWRKEADEDLQAAAPFLVAPLVAELEESRADFQKLAADLGVGFMGAELREMRKLLRGEEATREGTEDELKAAEAALERLREAGKSVAEDWRETARARATSAAGCADEAEYDLERLASLEAQMLRACADRLKALLEDR